MISCSPLTPTPSPSPLPPNLTYEEEGIICVYIVYNVVRPETMIMAFILMCKNAVRKSTFYVKRLL
jgi:hypothetical protein